MFNDTIAAISTAVSASGIGIIRVSGAQAMEIADRVYRSKIKDKKLTDVPTHTIHYGHICDGEEIIDEVLVMVMRAPPGLLPGRIRWRSIVMAVSMP